MRPFGIIVSDIFPDKISEMLFAEYEEMIQAFPPHRSHKTFCIRIKIRRAVRYSLDLGVKWSKQFIEFLWEFRISIPYEKLLSIIRE